MRAADPWSTKTTHVLDELKWLNCPSRSEGQFLHTQSSTNTSRFLERREVKNEIKMRDDDESENIIRLDNRITKCKNNRTSPKAEYLSPCLSVGSFFASCNAKSSKVTVH